MTYKRLTNDEKAAIVVAYGQGESIKALATQFSVSENTIRRTIKSGDGESHPVAPPSPPVKPLPQIVTPSPTFSVATPEPTPEVPPTTSKPLIRRRRSAPGQPEVVVPIPPATEAVSIGVSTLQALPEPLTRVYPALEIDSEEEEEDDLSGLAGEDLEDFADDDFEDEIEEEETDNPDDPTEAAEMLAEDASPAEIAIYPLDAAVLPRPCYLVIDTRSELLARPLGEFRGLGHASLDEEQQKTLPIFESRAVALRFSQRNQRIYKNSDSILRKTVVKVPDGNVLRKTTSYLQGKGITRLLIHGQVYALE
ncbi:helix-turn-helix domain-containing protein [Synechococcus sp. PCC 6312]|uniref:helix-turn-helix domain-containing protein n=1 Tax=Synechococcus sp. (strain ATCC 27167 / PCC 6312) TaxID=195253 RepID=UPI00029F4B75|nr:helix-turn-helix domain-containing protein [Synechococcus sp. PCC 6312]AFY59553.1 hypothetical protein Syn6312_0319 [Synechococcus sp. PCC 6312]